MTSRRSWFHLTLAAAIAAGAWGGRPARAQEKPPEAEAKKAEPEKKPEPPKPRIAVFRLSGAIKETPTDDVFNFGGESSTPLWTLVERLDKAAKDPAVKAVVVILESPTIGPAQVSELRQAFERVKAAGKEVIGHADNVGSLGQYVLLSGASRLSVVPTADLWITGIYGEAPYLRHMLEKIGVKPDFLTCGDYKSAAEMFMRDGPSKEAESMQNWLLDSLFDTMVARIAAGRKVSPELVKAWIDSGPHTAEKAKSLGVLDAVEHRQELEAHLKKTYGADVVLDRKYGKKEEPKLDASTPFGIFKFFGDVMAASKVDKKKPAVGVVYVDGPIVVDKSAGMSAFQDGEAASTTIRRALDDAANDDSIKAVVLRVDSPGGSALASEIILDATRRVKAKKPLVVSMGDVAGSGGYYVACASDAVFADEATITGSIGVVSGKMAVGGLYEKLGVAFKAYRRGQNAGMLASGDLFTPAERLKMQSYMDEIYGVFKGHVVAIRGGKLKKPIDDLAGGRVYTGKQAIELGLVDKLGGFHDAVAHAAEAAKIADYDVRTIPRAKSILEEIVEQSSGDDDRKGLVRSAVPSSILLEQAAPILKALDPARADAVRTALGRLELIRREGVVAMMPELGLGR
ncbi:signal peptide peptidase SppA [Paludisphaera mucosa]|uniref:Signal peptide peptidase SppA n=1 Tax=Paludisphaera mucosa TaxID=3030827 RepID=A0ABT6FHK4_9BACT|nr:signal peptide peptidase SppA [Paludisphaera mucosa]MDG3006868.1 signal peptide peptidase SppA [Paludisphaera mucosa]